MGKKAVMVEHRHDRVPAAAADGLGQAAGLHRRDGQAHELLEEIKWPSLKRAEDGSDDAAPFAREARYFVEPRLRDERAQLRRSLDEQRATQQRRATEGSCAAAMASAEMHHHGGCGRFEAKTRSRQQRPRSAPPTRLCARRRGG